LIGWSRTWLGLGFGFGFGFGFGLGLGFVEDLVRVRVRVRVRVEDLGEPQLVHVERGDVAVVEDQRVSQLVVRRQVEGRLVAQRGEEQLRERPRVVEVVERLLARAARRRSEAGEREG